MSISNIKLAAFLKMKQRSVLRMKILSMQVNWLYYGCNNQGYKTEWPRNSKTTQPFPVHRCHFRETFLILPLFCCICISLHVTPSNLFTCLLFSLLPSWRVSVTNFLIMSSQPESAWSVEALASETIMSHKVKFSKRWSTLFDDVVQYLLLMRSRKKKKHLKKYSTSSNMLLLWQGKITKCRSSNANTSLRIWLSHHVQVN